MTAFIERSNKLLEKLAELEDRHGEGNGADTGEKVIDESKEEKGNK